MVWQNPGRPVLTSFLGSVRRVQRSVTQMPAALSGSEHSRTRKIPRRSNAMTHAGSRERRTWEVWQGGQGMTHLYTRAGPASCQFKILLPPQTTTWESIFSSARCAFYTSLWPSLASPESPRRLSFKLGLVVGRFANTRRTAMDNKNFWELAYQAWIVNS